MLVAGLLIWLLGNDEADPESNRTSAETPTAKSPEVAKVVVDYEKLERRDGLWYFEEKPFTGVAVMKYPNGQKRGEITWKDGKQDGLYTAWHENGQKMGEVTYKDGKLHGLGTGWYENGQKRGEGTFKDGKPHGLGTKWYENGQKKEERTHKDGKLISEKRWDEDGNPE